MVKISEIKQKEVISLSDGRRLGIVYDVEINMEKGCIDAIIIPGSGRILGIFSKESDIIISWDSIKKIGVDAILVDNGGH